LDVEWSIDIETEVFIESLSQVLCRVNVYNSPSLVCSVVSVPDLNVLSFNILVSCNINNLLVVDIDNELIFISEDLEPATVSVRDLEIG